MANESQPLIRLGNGSEAPVLDYDIPDSTSYSGRVLIELDLPSSYFGSSTRKKPVRTPIKEVEFTTLRKNVADSMKTGFPDRSLFPNVTGAIGKIQLADDENPGTPSAVGAPTTRDLTNLNPDLVASAMQNNLRLNIFRSLHGAYRYNFLPEPTAARPRLFLVGMCRLSSYRGNYGAGRTIRTFSLLPGEKTSISIETFRKSSSSAKEASSILDSFSQESADDFENQVLNEQTDKNASADMFQYHAETSVKQGWGSGKVSVRGGVKGGMNSSLEEISKNVSNAVEKHSMKASAKRDVQVNTSYEVASEEGEKTSVRRTVENINVGRTLNFVFRQMNQEFISILHLVDLRVGYFNGYAESRDEVSLPELDSLLERHIRSTKQDAVRSQIVGELRNIFDHRGDCIDFVEERTLNILDEAGQPAGATYLRTRSDHVSAYTNDATDLAIDVPGVILHARSHVLRTDGVIVEALLGQGDALDAYSAALQEETVKSQSLANDLAKEQVNRVRLAQEIVSNGNEEQAALYEKVFPKPVRATMDLDMEVNTDGDQ